MKPGTELKPGALDNKPGIMVARDRGRIHMVRAERGGVLVHDDASGRPEQRAHAFVQKYGAVLGVSPADRAALPAIVRAVHTDELGTAVRLAQTYKGLPVLGGELVVNMNDDGITSINGTWIGGLALPTTPLVSAERANEIAVALAAKQAKDKNATVSVVKSTLGIFQKGLLDQTRTSNHLGWNVTVTSGDEQLAVWVDAIEGGLLTHYALNHSVKRRTAYERVLTPDVSPDPNYQPGPNAVCWDQSNGTAAPTNAVTCVGFSADLYRWSGQVYDLFFDGFMRDSYDGMGIRMKTVALTNQHCPNAYWDGTSTNYCPLFELDDVVAHEWGHAYTQYTHGLIYQYQSGALNESYSDIWGEVVDLHNAEDGIGGDDNARPSLPNSTGGQRWQVGEDFGTGSREYELLLRDMWNPERLSYPGTTDSPNYECGSGDQGGVHTNSGVPNQAFALLVDGTDRIAPNFTPGTCSVDAMGNDNCFAPLTCNTATSKCEFKGQQIRGIGVVKASAIYYRAMVMKQTPTTTFAQHADAIETSCDELVGTNPNEFLDLKGMAGSDTGAITTDDCAQVRKVTLGTGMRTPPSCPFKPMLEKNPPEPCRGAQLIRKEDWADGNLAPWTKESAPGPTGDAFPEDKYTWQIVNEKPYGQPGKAAHAPNFNMDTPDGGSCTPGGDVSGEYSIVSPVMTAPATGTVEVRFDHLMESEANVDGGQLYVKVGTGAWELVPLENFKYNGYNTTLLSTADGNTNPHAGEDAWSGADEGGSTSSWGTSVVDLTGLVATGQMFQLRFTFSVDGCNGVKGWWVGDVNVNHCPTLTAPVLSAAGLETPATSTDTNGMFTLNWTKPANATGPEDLEQSQDCKPQLDENANGTLAPRWTSTGTAPNKWQAGRTKPVHATAVFGVDGDEAAGDTDVARDANLVTTASYPLAAGKQHILRWEEWYSSEPDDRAFVEICKAASCPADVVGAPWEIVYTNDRAFSDSAAFFQVEEMLPVEINLTQHGGSSIKLRFRYHQGGAPNYIFYNPVGWFIDNIQLETRDWVPLATDQAERTFAINGRANGTYCFRARTAYTVGGNVVDSDWSNILIVNVNQPNAPVDTDQDTVPDSVDNCVTTPNTDQANNDGDPAGDACDCLGDDASGDGDNDDVCSANDNCPTVPNPDQADSDNDNEGDACDCAAGGDTDGDMVCDTADNCPSAGNTDQTDTDGDGAGDACDVCNGTSNTDGDADAVCDELDNCPAVGNPDQGDMDADGVGDACDCVAANDSDGDGACNDTDNCPEAANANQSDEDEDQVGDVCDVCVGAANDGDSDSDTICNANDNCPDAANTDQADSDGDGVGDICVDGCADADDDGVCDSEDACPTDSDPAHQDPGFCIIDDGGCGCSSSADLGPGAALWLVAGAFLMRRRRRARKASAVVGAAAAAAVVVTGASPATAEEVGSSTETKQGLTFELGAFFSGFVANSDHEFYQDNGTIQQAELGTVTPGFGARVALFPVPMFGVEVEGQFFRANVEGKDSATLLGLGGHLIGRVPGKVRPFALVGAATMGVTSDDMTLGKDYDGVAYGGLGVEFDISKSVALRADARGLRAPKREEVVEDKGTFHFLFGVGVSGVFGGRSQPAVIEKEVQVVEQPTDPDGDGIFGAADRCPEQAENVNSWEDTDGCPDTIPDTDGDKLNDVADKCRDNAEDFDSFQDEDGCPELDNDADNVADAADKCPIVAGVVENNGCPDTDRDKDTVVDRLDNCPDEAGTVANYGCKAKQLVVITPTKLQILEIVYFQVNRAALLPRSNKLLDQVASVLNAHPEITKIRIEGHTDDVGNDDYNLKLSQKRAEAVMAYLVRKKVDPSRLEAKGYGETMPLDPGKTREARAANRRVEFNIAGAPGSPAGGAEGTPAPAPATPAPGGKQ